jgi:gamma-glutamylaminecyclotransferase
MDRVFVYGTLKNGFPNHASGGMEHCCCLGRFLTVQSYPLVIGGRWNSPCLIDEPGHGHRVAGEVYTIDKNGLRILDLIESTALSTGYRRVRIDVAPEAGAAPISVWAYVKDRERISDIHTGALTEYTLDAGFPPYIPPRERP